MSLYVGGHMKMIGNTKTALLMALAISGFIAPLAHAQETSLCKDLNGTFRSECTNAIVSGTASTGTGYLAYKRFSEIGTTIRDNTIVMYDFPKAPQPIDSSLAHRVQGWVTEGDQVNVHYELSEPESRKWWIVENKRLISEAKSQAASYRADKDVWVSETTYTTETTTNSDGTTSTTEVPHTTMRPKTYFEKAQLESQAVECDEEAAKYGKELARIEAGGKVDLVRLKESIDTGDPKAESAEAFMEKEAARGSKLVRADKLPVQIVKAVKNLKWHGAGNLALTAILLGFSGYEMYQASQKQTEEYYEPRAYQRQWVR